MMGSLTASMLLPSKLVVIKNQPSSSLFDQQQQQSTLYFYSRGRFNKTKKSSSPVMRLFGPAIFEASKLQVLFLGGVDNKKHPGELPRTYTLTHSDITSKLTLAISQTINNSQLQGWYNKLQRDEVVAEWKKVKGKISLHVHCHISGGHFLLDLCAKLRYYIFSKELPVVLKAFVHGDEDLFNNHPELEESLVWVYFHSNVPEFNKVECWGPLKDASASATNGSEKLASLTSNYWKMMPQEPCKEACACCFPPISVIPWPSSQQQDQDDGVGGVGQTTAP